MTRFPLFDPKSLDIRPLGERGNDVDLQEVLALDAATPAFDHPDLPALARAILAARASDRPVILSMGAHVIKSGLSRFVIDLIERGLVTMIAGNGACVIHDFELALIGATSENVGRYIRDGRFGLWRETGRINDIVSEGNAAGLGLGESVGKAIAEGDFPNREISIHAAAWRAAMSSTVHVGIGYDITHAHANFDGAAFGEASYRDFLIYARVVQDLEGGVFMNFGSAVMGPEVYLKALSMARNAARQKGEEIRRFTTAVFDLADLPETYRTEPPKTEPLYYFRPWKTILARTVADGGESFFFRGDHQATIPALHRVLVRQG